jgi:hypothetical protein
MTIKVTNPTKQSSFNIKIFLYKTSDFHCFSMSKAAIPLSFHCLPLLKQWGVYPPQFSMKNEEFYVVSPLQPARLCAGKGRLRGVHY